MNVAEKLHIIAVSLNRFLKVLQKNIVTNEHHYPVAGPLWSWSYVSWIYNYLCNQWLRRGVLDITLSLSVICDRSVVFSRYSCFLHQQNKPPWYNWKIVENGVKHHNPLSSSSI